MHKRLRGAIALSTAIFFADASHSAAIPTFPAFAQTLGASFTLIGALVSASGISTTLSSIPLGGASDRLGRRRIMQLGFLFLVVTPLIYTVSSEPLHLLVARILLGVAMGSTFSIGFLYVSELTEPQIRNLAQGVYMTAMGLGFTLGPLVGGVTAKAWGYSSSFCASSGLALVGFFILLTMRGEESKIHSRAKGLRGGPAGFVEVLSSPRILVAGAANFLNSLLYTALVTFFPLYGLHVGLDESGIGFAFTVRNVSSTAVRFPTGALARTVGVLRLMTVGIGMSALTCLLLPSFSSVIIISVLLGILGIAYGIYYTAGNAFMAEEAPPEVRGVAMGAYSTFSNVSGVVSPLILGAIADGICLEGVFQLSGAMALVGLTIVSALGRRGRSGKGII